MICSQAYIVKADLLSASADHINFRLAATFSVPLISLFLPTKWSLRSEESICSITFVVQQETLQKTTQSKFN